MSQQQWDEYMLGIADAVAKKSKDPNSKLGAVLVRNNIVVATGFNGFPRGIDEGPERWVRPTKYAYVSHAESNAINNAARLGIQTEGTGLYLSGFPGPCIECAKAIIQSGIIRVAWWTDTLKLSDPEARAKWEADLTFARGLLTEAGVIWTDVTLAGSGLSCYLKTRAEQAQLVLEFFASRTAASKWHPLTEEELALREGID